MASSLKTCSTCSSDLPIQSFPSCGNGRTRPQCKSCLSAARKKLRALMSPPEPKSEEDEYHPIIDKYNAEIESLEDEQFKTTEEFKAKRNIATAASNKVYKDKCRAANRTYEEKRLELVASQKAKQLAIEMEFKNALATLNAERKDVYEDCKIELKNVTEVINGEHRQRVSKIKKRIGTKIRQCKKDIKTYQKQWEEFRETNELCKLHAENAKKTQSSLYAVLRN